MIVAIAGNAVEHAVGVVLAAKGQSELAISVVKNSVAQIAAFLFPLLVLASLLTATTLTFALAPVYTGALIGTAVIIWQITGDGEATPFEGDGADRGVRDPGHGRRVRAIIECGAATLDQEVRVMPLGRLSGDRPRRALAAAALLGAPAVGGERRRAPSRAPTALAPELTFPCAGARLKCRSQLLLARDRHQSERPQAALLPVPERHAQPAEARDPARRRVRPRDLRADERGQGPSRPLLLRGQAYSFQGYWLVTKGTWYVQVQQVDGHRHTRRQHAATARSEKVTIR